MGDPLPIPFSEIDCYARRFGPHGDAFERFLEMIQIMDQTLLSRRQ